MSRDVSTLAGSDSTYVQEVEDGVAPRGWLVGRYEIGDLLGRGGSGQVHRAHDHLVGEDVAVKFVSGRGQVAARLVRRELTALRLLDLPGVVGLRDDGWLESDQIFIVMDLLVGGTFDQLAQGAWDTWRPAAVRFLESLAQVHFAGVLHRDLKPSNVLLDGSAQPVITDFGLAAGLAVEDASRGVREGTPRYMAPEQARGEPCDVRTDLFAVGVMFAEMLDGKAPPELHEVIRAMQEPEPGNRPASVLEVLEAIGAGTAGVLPSLEGLATHASPDALVPLFREPEPSFLHVAEDGARWLYDRTNGDSGAVSEELQRWVRSGRCRWEAGQIVIERAALDRLAWEPEVRALLAVEGEDAGTRLLDRALSVLREGYIARGFGLLDAAIPLLEEGASSRRALEHLVGAALSLGRQQPVRQAIYRCDRASARDLGALLRGVSLSWGGDRERAIEMLSVPIDGDTQEPELGRWAHLVQACCAVAQDRLDDVLDAAWKMCRGGGLAEGRWHIWQGHAHYVRRDFEAALASHERAAELLGAAPMLRLAAVMSAGQAALDAGRPAQAAELAARAGDLAATLRYAVGECRAVILARHAAYRAREPWSHVPGLVAAAEAVSRRLGLEMAVFETISARGTAHAAGLAQQAVARVREGDGIIGTVARSLGCALAGLDLPSEEAMERLPGPIRLQTEALLVGRRPPPQPGQIATWSASWPAKSRMRLDVLSLDECLSAFD